jgi:hypothetical protein
MERTQKDTKIDWPLLMQTIRGSYDEKRMNEYKNEGINYENQYGRNILHTYIEYSFAPNHMVIKNLIKAGAGVD